MKIYTNPTCHYCKRVKEVLDSNEIKYEEILTGENQEEWNELIRVTGLAMTPTIVMQEEIWLPTRDFRTPEDLVNRVKHFQQNPMKVLVLEERIEQLNNQVKNMSLLFNQMNQSLQKIERNTTPVAPDQNPMNLIAHQ